MILVTIGEYSDKKIIGLFSTEEKADDCLKYFPDSNGKKIPMTLDTYNKYGCPEGYLPYEVKMNLNSGDNAIATQIALHWCDPEYGSEQPGTSFHSGLDFYHVCFATDQNHAIKIANEKRTQYRIELDIRNETKRLADKAKLDNYTENWEPGANGIHNLGRAEG